MSERKTRHILDIVRSLLLESSVLARFLPEAPSTTVNLINQLPSPRIENQNPYCRLFGRQPQYSHLHTFGRVCFALLPPTKCTKRTTQSSRCAFLGFATNQKGYLCYNLLIKRVRISRNVMFLQKSIFFMHNSR